MENVDISAAMIRSLGIKVANLTIDVAAGEARIEALQDALRRAEEENERLRREAEGGSTDGTTPA